MRPDPVALILKMHDYTEIDPATKPLWGAVGGWMYWSWSALNSAPGVYDWSAGQANNVDEYLDRAAAMGKPVAISCMLYEDLDADSTPLWVYGTQKIDNVDVQLHGWPIIVGGVDTGMTFPKWNDGAMDWSVNPAVYREGRWESYFHTFVSAFGARFNGDPRVHSVWICTARYGETVTDGMGEVTHDPVRFFRNAIDWYDAAFPDTPLFMIHSSWSSRRELALYCADRNVGSKMNLLGEDVSNHVFDGDFGPVPGTGSAEVAYYATQTLGNWMAYEHG